MAAGADIAHDRGKLETIFKRVGFVFLFAPLHHQAMKYVMPVRQKIAAKTIFNLLGPHTNPCNSKRQLLGVYDKNLLSTFSHVAKNLDMEHVLVVHGDDGLDEISPYDKTIVKQLKNGEINEMIIDPKELKVNADGFDKIVGNDAKFNSQKIIFSTDVFKTKPLFYSIENENIGLSTFATPLKDLGFKMATSSGLSISVSDVLIPQEKNSILSSAFDKVGDIKNKFDRRRIGIQIHFGLVKLMLGFVRCVNGLAKS